MFKFLLLFSLFVLPAKSQTSKTEEALSLAGYVNVRELDPTLQVSLMYARADNFVGVVLYDDLRQAYLHPDAAAALVKAQKRLKQLHPELSLKIYDAARPMHIQQKMWNKVKNTPMKPYVSNPANGGGLHNYGLAVDITLCDAKGDSIAMGTKIDHLGPEAHIDTESQLVAKGIISKRAQQNRQLMRQVMRYAGFKPLRTEWWHFNFKSRAEAKRHYKVIK